MITCPKQLIGKNDLRHAYLGMKLPERGRETGDWLSLDWKSGPGIMVAAAANSGKSVVINTLIAAALEAGFSLPSATTRTRASIFNGAAHGSSPTAGVVTVPNRLPRR